MSGRVVLTRPREKSRALEHDLRQAGWEPVVLPLTHVAHQSFDLPEKIGGFILTSPSAVFALPQDHRDIPVFAVGAGSAAAAQSAGFSHVTNGGGDAAALLNTLRVSKDVPQPLIWLSGEDTATDLTAALLEQGLACERVVVYRIEAQTIADADLQFALSPAPDAVLLHSARAARLFQDRVQDLARSKSVSVKDTTIITLSKRIESVITLDCAEIRIAKKPDDAGLLAELAALGHKRSR